MTRAELFGELAAFPGATCGYPFDAATRVYKVGGKIFAITDDVAEPLKVSLKCAPDLATQLRDEFPGTVVPGYHLNKRHWNTVTVNDCVSDDDLRDWFAHSYELVFASLPRVSKKHTDTHRAA